MLEQLLEWDRDTFIYLNNLGVNTYDSFWILVTDIKTWIPLYIFFGFLFLYKTSFKEGVVKVFTVVALTLFIILITDLTKNYFLRLRPNNDVELNTLIRVLITPRGYSFFSGHAASSFAITVSVVLLLGKKYKWKVLFFIWPLLFTASRIYVGVHYPLDLITGALVGISVAFLFYYLHNNFIKDRLLPK